jgi:hypothetical protein
LMWDPSPVKKTIFLCLYPAHLDVFAPSFSCCVRREANQLHASFFYSTNMNRCCTMY